MTYTRYDYIIKDPMSQEDIISEILPKINELSLQNADIGYIAYVFDIIKLNSYFIKAWKKNHYLSQVIKENNLSDNDLNEIIKLLSNNFDKVNNKGAISNLFIGGYDSDKNIYNKPKAEKQEEMRKIIESNLNSVNTNKKYANFNKQLSKYITETIVNNAHKFPPLIKKFKELNLKILY